MQDKAEDKAKFRRESLQLQRLARMVDVVYAIVIWRIFTKHRGRVFILDKVQNIGVASLFLTKREGSYVGP